MDDQYSKKIYYIENFYRHINPNITTSDIKDCINITLQAHKYFTQEQVMDVIIDYILSNTSKFLIKSSPINLNQIEQNIISGNDPAKNDIFYNITNRNYSFNNLASYAHRHSDKHSKWGCNKNEKRSLQKFKKYLQYFPKEIDVCVDIGCGDGIDISYIGKTYNIKYNVCVDINDERDIQYKNGSNFIKLELDKSLPIENNSVDLVLMFHVIHHIMDGLMQRFQDIYRIMKFGGVLCIKDHNISNSYPASNVDWQHYIYAAPSHKNNLRGLAKNMDKIIPMIYYTSDDIWIMLDRIGFKRVYVSYNNNDTYTYDSIFVKE